MWIVLKPYEANYEKSSALRTLYLKTGTTMSNDHVPRPPGSTLNCKHGILGNFCKRYVFGVILKLFSQHVFIIVDIF